MAEEKAPKIDVHSVSTQQDHSFEITRWQNLPMQIYPSEDASLFCFL